MNKDNMKISQQECRDIMLRLMDVIDTTCRQNGLNYFIGYGTLLGAVRHKGFIPWDDDIDVIMLREDYDKFINIIKRESEANDLQIVTPETDGYYNPFCKVCDSRTIAQEDYRKEGSNSEYGIWVDVFPYENFPTCNEKSRKNFMRKAQLLRGTIIAMQTDFMHERFGLKYLTKLFLWIISQIVGKKHITEYDVRYTTMYNGRCSDFVGCTFTPYRKDYFERRLFSETIELVFEGHKYLASPHYEAILNKLYGNYMQLPPENKRKTHRVTAYWK